MIHGGWTIREPGTTLIKEIIFRASERLHLPVILVANKRLSKHNSELMESIVVADDFDVADYYYTPIKPTILPSNRAFFHAFPPCIADLLNF